MSEDPIQRFTLLVLFQAQQDRATELTIASAISGRSPITYKVGALGTNMSAPPAHIMAGVVAQLETVAAFTKRPFLKEGLIDVPYSGVRLRWIIRMATADAACMLTPVEQ